MSNNKKSDEAKKQLDILSKEKEEFLEQNNKLLADISEKKKALENENERTLSNLESLNSKINSLKTDLLEAKTSNNKQSEEAKKQLDILSKKKEEFLKQNKQLLADISEKEIAKHALANENKIKTSELE